MSLPLFLAFTTFIFIGIGLWQIKRRKIHVCCMLGALAMELVVVYLLQTGRHVVQRSMDSPPPILIIHITLAVTILSLYAAQTVSGIQVHLHGRWRGGHRIMGWALVALKAINIVISIFLPKAAG
ncbi:MAG: hypothetical protein QGF00_26190 [Planctomycetota bacterium]|jgi:uncharacterized membrane protein YozB (DUF420 family)|nr:hypothetical protein [Planctomycetota bacterium]MDP7253120.1 hypothetical protein [Planctomycetota bacterium]